MGDTYTVYSRDLMVAPVRQLQAVIDQVHAGRFVPDAPRRDFFNEQTIESTHRQVPTVSEKVPLGVTCKKEHADEQAVDEVVESSQASDASESEVESLNSSMDELPPTRVKRFRPKVPQMEEWFVHQKSHILHKLDTVDPYFDRKYFLCGKRLTDAYCRSTDVSTWNVMCKICNKRM